MFTRLQRVQNQVRHLSLYCVFVASVAGRIVFVVLTLRDSLGIWICLQLA